jgi:hypothetical protein
MTSCAIVGELALDVDMMTKAVNDLDVKKVPRHKKPKEKAKDKAKEKAKEKENRDKKAKEEMAKQKKDDKQDDKNVKQGKKDGKKDDKQDDKNFKKGKKDGKKDDKQDDKIVKEKKVDGRKLKAVKPTRKSIYSSFYHKAKTLFMEQKAAAGVVWSEELADQACKEGRAAGQHEVMRLGLV